ncbi:hypothetical protein [Citrobacter portucalensis]|nr:hypothetical protein [Citrobacter portucalensis]MBW9457282.1 hypothetical protein [Citrobacter portucalensis]
MDEKSLYAHILNLSDPWQVKSIKARGYRNRERFKLGVMFHYGKLNMAF